MLKYIFFVQPKFGTTVVPFRVSLRGSRTHGIQMITISTYYGHLESRVFN